ncbi:MULTISPECIES: hypothetical protein [Clostridium]|uniref:hypothetical protein n=1 Tax=Clostridium TaxID=1485 RepID=UPI000E07D761|nr:hypothetical protein [Clostridium sporogenes]MCW6085490.1 hypothetical protein [Clostridium sporogenes]STC83891.1 Uncharacterised protein [Clostridium botulinum]
MKIAFMYCKRKNNKKKKLLKTIGKIALIINSIIITQCVLPNIVLASADDAVNSANKIGFEVWKVIKMGSMWIMAGFAVKDILESLNDGDHKAIGKILFKYGLAFGAITFLIKYFLWIDTLSKK